MTPPLPLPVRVAAGLVVTAVEQARDLPRQARDLPRLALELPVTAVSQALQASMRVQQKVTELAIKGDRVLGAGPPIEDEPPWATFDDDEAPPRRRNGRATATAEADVAPRVPPVRPPARATADRPTSERPTSDRPEPDSPAADPFGDPEPVGTGLVEAVPVGPELPPAGPADTARDSATDPDDAPPVLPGYAELTIPQLRGKLRHLGVEDLRALLAWEQAHGDRPPYVTMLTNRIATVSGQ
jgi:hypothetical protein